MIKERERINTYDSVTATTVSTCTPLRKDSEESVDDLDAEDNSNSNCNNNEEQQQQVIVVTVDDTLKTTLKP
jgi:uncharacterized Zn-finger protein